MIKELINFTENLDSHIKEAANNISKGIHLLIDIDPNENLFVSETFNTDSSDIEKDDYKKIFEYQNASSYLDMNKQQKFDKNQKIHSASPFAFAFNFSLGNDKKNIELKLKRDIESKKLSNSLQVESKNYKIEEVKKSISSYFSNAKRLCLGENSDFDDIIQKFEVFCTEELFEIIRYGENRNSDEKVYRAEFDKLGEKDYIRVYLICVPLSEWHNAYNYYFESEYPPNNYIPNDFFSSTYNQKKPFLIHQTATFDKNILIKGSDALILNEFDKIVSAKPKVLPNPLPIFIYKKELQNKLISLVRENGKISFQEIIDKLWNFHKSDFQNYYLINWFYGKDFQIIDLDFVPSFSYELLLEIRNLFEVKERNSSEYKHYPLIKNIFELEKHVFAPLLQNIKYRIEYFRDLDPEDYKDRTKTPNAHYNNRFISYSKYRKAIYDYVYKSQRNTIDGHIFDEMVFNAIKDDIKNNNDYGIKEKLNIWYSSYEYFNTNNKINMVNKLKDYQNFVAAIIADEPLADITDEKFAFAAGQVIEYILSKSKSADNSYNLLEPYLQQAKCTEFKRAIANDFGRYKHENFSKNFEKVAAFVLSYETPANLKHLLPQILSGVFSKNQLFSTNLSK
jgi:CRISPR-associated protein Csh1